MERLLKESQLYLDDDLTKDEVRIRRERMPQFRQLRADGGKEKPVDWRRATIVQWLAPERMWKDVA